MKSTRGVLLGLQEPRVSNFPKFHSSHADDAAFLSSAYGLTPDEWQFSVLEAWLGVDRRGRWTAGRCGLAVPRQNGKNGLVEIVELFKMVVLGRKILHTAHEVKTARKAFTRLCSFFENERRWPELAALVREVRRTNGQEAVVLDNGGSCEFVARSRGSGRGYTVDDLVFDEAQELTDEQLEALFPTISAAPSGDPQLILIGTPPGPNSPGEVFTRARQAGVQGKDRRLSWHEWSAERGDDVKDPAVWAATNPSLGSRLGIAVVQDELAQMSLDGFARERCGLWADDASRRTPTVIDSDRWAAGDVDAAPLEGTIAYGVKVSADGRMLAVAAAIRPPDDGTVHVEGVFHVPMVQGTAWLVSWLADRQRSASLIVVDGRAGAGALVASLRKAGIPQRRLLQPSVEQVITAHATLFEAVAEGTITHLADPALAGAVASAARRKIGALGGWGFEGIGGADVTLLEAATLAHYGASIGRTRRVNGEGSRRAVVA